MADEHPDPAPVWLDIHGKPARVVESDPSRLVADVYVVPGQPPQRFTYQPAIHGPFPPLPADRIPKGGD
jgi:hypothetical protein